MAITFIDNSETNWIYTALVFFKFTPKNYIVVYLVDPSSAKRKFSIQRYEIKYLSFFSQLTEVKTNKNNKKGETTTQGVDVGAF